MSTPPGRTRAPEASSTLRPRGLPPIWTTLPSSTPRSHSPELPAVTTVPPRMTRSHSMSGIFVHLIGTVRITSDALTCARPLMAYLPGRWCGGKLVAMTDGHGHHGDETHGHEDHVHDASCSVAHGTASGPAEAKVLAAVFASPVASYLLRYGSDAGYR